MVPSPDKRELEQLWIRAQYASQMTSLGTLDDEVSISRSMGYNDVEIRKWVTQRLRDSLSSGGG
jgi:hypothetical protein